jgi:flavin reductase (DIM6/NTAB) family NADH-FMN oxidoreductase RutF/DNA-binding GntR family transcriptional regulator
MGTPTTTAAAETFDPEAFRHVIGHLTSGVSVITTIHEGTRYGMTASSVTSLSMDPPMMLICVNKSVPTSAAISAAKVFSVNVLSNRSEDLARQFAAPSVDKFHGVELRDGVTGVPLLEAALARIECHVVEEVAGGTHAIFLGRVADASASAVGEPLAYFRGAFGRFEFASFDEVYLRARQLVLDRQYAADSVLDPIVLAEDLEASEDAIFYALTRLSADGLIRRDPERGYVIVPFDLRMCSEVFDARCAVELGAIDLAAQDLDPDRVTGLRSLVAEMQGCLSDDLFTDFERYLDANYRLHLGIVALSSNAALTSFFKALSVKTIMARSFGSTKQTSQEFIDVQSEIVEGLAASDFEKARQATRRYTMMAKRRVEEIVREQGGAL